MEKCFFLTGLRILFLTFHAILLIELLKTEHIMLKICCPLKDRDLEHKVMEYGRDKSIVTPL